MYLIDPQDLFAAVVYLLKEYGGSISDKNIRCLPQKPPDGYCGFVIECDETQQRTITVVTCSPPCPYGIWLIDSHEGEWLSGKATATRKHPATWYAECQANLLFHFGIIQAIWRQVETTTLGSTCKKKCPLCQGEARIPKNGIFLCTQCYKLAVGPYGLSARECINVLTPRATPPLLGYIANNNGTDMKCGPPASPKTPPVVGKKRQKTWQ